ncbi:MAG: hypothetical protein SCARUB_04687 [Candidatus Scalindua rubra]|uniref:Uncharacterized protein n=1 Tax=Candidatus Scalindua rubra TaxID=1872076 RepID=A0A1E3X3I7_9BACT|nr:MAG: hypothetical protein SCARUB_04687 [Candidatus Scalindua rubra]
MPFMEIFIITNHCEAWPGTIINDQLTMMNNREK